MVMGGDLQPGCLADWLVAGHSQPGINPEALKQKIEALCFADEGDEKQIDLQIYRLNESILRTRLMHQKVGVTDKSS
eukprot:262319-Pelagomonas_calceolata.AAC.1